MRRPSPSYARKFDCVSALVAVWRIRNLLMCITQAILRCVVRVANQTELSLVSFSSVAQLLLSFSNLAVFEQSSLPLMADVARAADSLV